jgi:hypothetical protein
MPRKMPTQYTGGQVDESLKNRTKKMLINLPQHDELLEALKVLFGRYRSLARSRDTEPSRDKEIRHTKKTLNLISELKSHLNETPESIKAQISLYEWRLKREIEPQPFGQLNRQLDELSLFAGRAMEDARQWKSQGGALKYEEHDLLAQVSSLIEHRGLKVTASAGLASEILLSEGVLVPEDPEKARSCILKALKRQHPRD